MRAKTNAGQKIIYTKDEIKENTYTTITMNDPLIVNISEYVFGGVTNQTIN